MAESRGVWIAKTLGMVVLAAVITSLLTTFIQQMIWKKSNGGVSGGAAAGVAVAVWMSRRRQLAETPVTPAQPKL